MPVTRPPVPSVLKIVLPVAVVLGLHTLFVLTNAYSATGLDSVMHLLGGVVLGVTVDQLLLRAVAVGHCPCPGRLLSAVLIVSVVATGAVIWEFYEWLSDHLLGTELQLTLDDTIKDMAVGLTGGILAAWRLDRLRLRNPLARLICGKQAS